MRISVFFFILIGFQCAAQITVQNNTFPSVGDTLLYQTDQNPPALFIGAAGGGQLWDFTAIQGGPVQKTVYLSANTGAAFSEFPNAELRSEETLRSAYFRKTSSVFENLGVSGEDQFNLGLNTNFHYQPPLPERRAPMQFFDVHNLATDLNWSVSTGELADSLLGQLGGLIDSLRFRIHTTRLDVVDGWGTCKIPGGTFEVLREERTEMSETSIDVHSFLGWTDLSGLLGGGGSSLLGQIGKDTTVTYHFFSNTEKEAIAVLTLSNTENVVQSARFKYIPQVSAVAGFLTGKPILSVSPNPATQYLVLGFENFPSGNYALLTSDISGKLLAEQTISLYQNTSLPLQLNEMPAGVLLLRIIDKEGHLMATQKLLHQP